MRENLPEEVKKAKEKGEKIFVLKDENAKEMYFIKPTARHSDMIFDRLSKGAKASVMRDIVLGLAVYPNRDELSKIFEDQPFLHLAISSKIFDGTGMNKDFLIEEL